MKTLIIGAGISGLVTARELTKVGRTVVVVEPRARAGGRIMTRRSAVGGFAVDLGPEFVHGNPPETRALVPDAATEIIQLFERERLFWRGVTEPVDGDRTESITAALSARSPDAPIADAVAELNLNERDHALMIAFIEGFNAADARRLSTNTILDETRNATDDLLNNYRLLTGYHAVTERLVDDIRRAGGEFRFNQTVRDVRWTTGRAAVGIRRADGEYDEVFDHVVNTVPISCFRDVTYEPPLPEHQRAAAAMEMGQVRKITFTFREKLWEIPEHVTIDFWHAPELSFNTRWAWGWVDQFTVTCWAGGRRAEAMRECSESDIVDRALEELALTLAREPSSIRALVTEIFHHDWGRDLHARGAYSYVLVGGETARRDLGQSVANTLFFAGEATDRTGAAGTVHGAIRSGLRVAHDILGRDD